MNDAPGTVRIGDRLVGPGAPALVVAEVAQAHEGSLGLAQSFVDAAADAGADAIKFQTHLASAESTYDETFRIRMSGQDDTRFDYWRRMEFTPDQWRDLAERAAARGLLFLSTAFSVEAVELLDELGVPAWKVGSAEVADLDFLGRLASTGKPVVLSSGMSTWAEMETAVAQVRAGGGEPIVLQCTSKYPSTFAEVGLNVVDEIRTRFECPAGLSDHTGSPLPALAALSRGADVVEVHVTFSRTMYGPDAAASLTFDELRLVAQGRDAVHEMLGNAVDKDAVAETLEATRSLFHRSLALRESAPAGTTVTADMLTTKKPGTGISSSQSAAVVGRTLTRAVAADRLLDWADLEPDATTKGTGR